MLRTFGILIGVMLAVGSLRAAQQPPAIPASASQFQMVLSRYCITCHSDRLKTAGLTLEKLDLVNAPANAETWEKVIRKLRGG